MVNTQYHQLQPTNGPRGVERLSLRVVVEATAAVDVVVAAATAAVRGRVAVTVAVTMAAGAAIGAEEELTAPLAVEERKAAMGRAATGAGPQAAENAAAAKIPTLRPAAGDATGRGIGSMSALRRSTTSRSCARSVKVWGTRRRTARRQHLRSWRPRCSRPKMRRPSMRKLTWPVSSRASAVTTETFR